MAVGKTGVRSSVAVLLALACLCALTRPALAAEWETYLSDDFSGPESMFFTGQAGEALYSIDEQGSYIINGLDTTSDSLSALTDGMYYYYLEASVNLLSSKAENLAFAGLVFHYNKKLEDKLSYYVFYIYGDGYYGAKRVIGDQVDIIIPLTMSDQIKIGSSNVLGVDAQGTRFDLYINGKFVNGFTDVRIDGGGFGFYISKQSEAAFDDFSIRIEQKPGGHEPESPANAADEDTGTDFHQYAPPYIPKDPKRPTYPWEVGVDKTGKRGKNKPGEQGAPEEKGGRSAPEKKGGKDKGRENGGGVKGPGEEGSAEGSPPEEEPAKPPPDEKDKGKTPPKKNSASPSKSSPAKSPAKQTPPPESKPAPPPPAEPAGDAAQPEPATAGEPDAGDGSDVTLVPQEELDAQDQENEEIALIPGQDAAAAQPGEEPAAELPLFSPGEDTPAANPADEEAAPDPPAEKAPPAEKTEQAKPKAKPDGAAAGKAEKKTASKAKPEKAAAGKDGDDLAQMRARQGDWLDSGAAPPPAKEKDKAPDAKSKDEAAKQQPEAPAGKDVTGKTEEANEPETGKSTAEKSGDLSLLPEKEQPAKEADKATEQPAASPAETAQPAAAEEKAVDVALPPAGSPEPAADGAKLAELPVQPEAEAAALVPPAGAEAPAVPDVFAGRSGVVEIKDDFTEQRWPMSENDTCAYRYFGAAYEIDNQKAGTMAISFQQDNMADMDLACDLEYLDGLSYVGYGLAARFQVHDGQVSYYGLFLSQSGEFLLLKVVDGKETVLEDWTATPELHPNQPNRARLVILGDQIQAFINGQLTATITDDGITAGGYALLVGPGTAARFDNMALRGIPPQ